MSQRQKHGECKRTCTERGRTSAALCPVSPALRQTHRMQEEPCGAPDATRPGFQGEWEVPDVVIGDAPGPACQYTKRDAREK